MNRRAAPKRVVPPVSDTDKRLWATELLRRELVRLGCTDLQYTICFSDPDWRQAMDNVGCPVHNERLESPTARRGTRGKLGMATICHFRHDHPAVVYVRVQGQPWKEVVETVQHEALHLAKPSYGHRKLHEVLHAAPVPRLTRQLSFNI